MRSPLAMTTTSEQEIRDLVADWLKAVHTRDVDAAMAHYAPDFVGYDIFPPTKVVGSDGYRENYKMWFSSCSPDQGYEIHELSVTAGDDVAFCRSINKITTPLTGGGEEVSWLRVTVCFKKIDGAWKVIHEHVSVPVDMQTRKGVFDFQP